MRTEVVGSALLQESQARAEFQKLAVLLKGECVDILDAHGVLERKRDLARIPRIANKLFDSRGLTLRECSIRRIYKTEIKIVDKVDPVSVKIISLGKVSPRNANHLLIYIPSLDPLTSVDIAKGEPKLRFLDTGDNIVDRSDRVDVRKLADYSRMINAVKANLPKKPHA